MPWRVELQPLSADPGGAFLLGESEIFEVGVQLPRIDHWTDLSSGAQGVTDIQLGHLCRQPLHEPIMDPIGDNQPFRCRAALTGLNEGAVEGAMHRHVEVRVIQNDQWVLAAHLQLNARHPADCPGSDRPSGGDGARKSDCVDTVDQRVAHHRAAAHHQIDYSGGRSGTVENIHQRPGARRDEVCRLEHNCIAEGQGWTDFPRCDRDRKIPGRDHPDHTHRLARHINVDTRPHRREFLSGHPDCFAREIAHDFGRAKNFADSLRAGFPFLAGKQLAQFVTAGEQLRRNLVEQVGLGLRGRPPPRRLRSPGSGQGIGNILFRRRGIFTDHVVRIAWIDVRPSLIDANPFSADEIGKRLHDHELQD